MPTITMAKPLQIMAMNSEQSCYIATDSRVYCWGDDIDSSLLESKDDIRAETPVLMTGSDELKDKKFKSFSSGHNGNTCAIDNDDLAYCWSTYGTNAKVPKAAKFNDTFKKMGLKTKSVASGMYSTCVLTSADSVYCWGKYYLGQSEYAPTQPTEIDMQNVKNKTVKSLSAGSGHYCFVTADGLAYCWGENDNGQLGDGTKGNNLIPVQVKMGGALKDKTIKSISPGDDFTCAIASDDKPYCWGSIIRYVENPELPYDMSLLGDLFSKTVKTISAGDSHACAIASDDLAYCWGSDGERLGYGYKNTSKGGVRKTPKAVKREAGVLKDKTIKAISTSWFSSCALASDDKIYCWGEIVGTGGQGTTILNQNKWSSTPVLIH